MSSTSHRHSAINAGEYRLYRFEYVSRDVFEEAVDRFTDWTDLNASLTDFVVAQQLADREIDHIVTYDRHYDCFDVTTLPYRD